MSDQKVVITGDSSGYVAAQERARKATDKTTDALRNQGRQSAQTAGTLEKVGRQWAGLARTMVAVTAVSKALGAAGQAATNAVQREAALSKTMGARALGIDVGMRPATGLTQEDRLSLAGAVGAGTTTPEEDVAFLSKIAKQRGRRLNLSQAMNQLGAFQAGAFTEDELNKALEKGRDLDIQGRMADLSPAARRELATRREERRGQAATDAAILDRAGRRFESARFVEQETARRQAASFGKETVEGLATEIPLGIGEVIRGGVAAGTQRNINDRIESAINENTKEMRRGNRPVTVGGAKE